MATPNYSYEKRQRELAKKRKAEEKRQKKTTGGTDQDDGSDSGTAPDGSTPAGQEPSLPTGQPGT